MRKILAAIALALTATGCMTTYYTYYEVDSPEMATFVSEVDAHWQRNHKSPARVITAYKDSTDRTVFLMEEKTKERMVKIAKE